MYNLWIVAIIVAVIEIVLIVLLVRDVLDDDALVVIIFTVLAIVAPLLIAFSIVDPIMATSEVDALLVERDALLNLFENREDLDKIYITQRVVEYNKEVARIIGKVKAFGNWSPYAVTDYELLTLIEI